MNMKFKELGKKERILLLDALGFDIDNLKCHFCGNKTTLEECSIMPYLHKGDKKKHTTILCNSILCLTEYIVELEKWENEKYATKKGSDKE